MTSKDPSDDILEQAALYALGALEGEELQGFEQRVAEGCSTCQAVEKFRQVANLLATAVTSVKPRPELRGKLFERVRTASHSSISEKSPGQTQVQSPSSGFTFVHAGETEWQEAGPGMWLKVLYADPAKERMTAMVRIAPGSNYAPHRHAGAEELYVLEGTCFCGGRLLHAGDYHRKPPQPMDASCLSCFPPITKSWIRSKRSVDNPLKENDATACQQDQFASQ